MTKGKKLAAILVSSILGGIMLIVGLLILIAHVSMNNAAQEAAKYEFTDGDFVYYSESETSPLFVAGLSEEGKKKDTIVFPFELNGRLVQGFTAADCSHLDFRTAKTIVLGASGYGAGRMLLGENTTVYGGSDLDLYKNVLSTKSELYVDETTYNWIRDNYDDLSRVHMADVIFRFQYNNYSIEYVSFAIDGVAQYAPQGLKGEEEYLAFAGWETTDGKDFDITKDKITSSTILFPKYTDTRLQDYVLEYGVLKSCSYTEAKIITIPESIDGESITSISEECFSNLPNLEKIIIPSTIHSIGDFAFLNDKSLKEVVIAPNNNLSLGKNLFVGCTSLTSFNVPRGVGFDPEVYVNSNITDFTFDESKYKVKNNLIVDTEANWVCYAVPGFENYEVPAGVTVIAQNAFANNHTVKSVILNDVEDLLDNAFANSSVQTLTNNNVKKVRADVFTNTPYLNNQTDKFVIMGDSLIKVNSNDAEIVVPEGVKYFSANLSSKNKKLVLPTTTESIFTKDLSSVTNFYIYARRYNGKIIDKGVFSSTCNFYGPSSTLNYYTSHDIFSNAFYNYCNKFEKLDIVITYKNSDNTISGTINTKMGARIEKTDVSNSDKFLYFEDLDGNKYNVGDFYYFYKDTTLTAVYEN